MRARASRLPTLTVTRWATRSSRAARLFWDNRDAWNQLVTQAMSQDFSWTRSADKYLDLYFFMHPEIERRSAAVEAAAAVEEPVAAEELKAEEKPVEAKPVKADPEVKVEAAPEPEPEVKPAAKPATKKTTTRKVTAKKATTTKAAASRRRCQGNYCQGIDHAQAHDRRSQESCRGRDCPLR